MKCFFGLLITACLVMALAGCSSSSSSNGVVPYGSNAVSGVASKGPIKGGTVSAYKIVDGVKGDLLGTDTTSTADGSYSIDMGDYTGPVLVEIQGGIYKDEATGTDVALTSPLQAAVADAAGAVTIAVTPLTDLAVSQASPGGLTPDKIDAANKLVSQLIGGDGTDDLITGTLPVDATDSVACGSADAAQLAYSLFLAALSQASYDESMSIDDFLDEFKDDFLDDLDIDETGVDILLALKYFLGAPNNQTGLGEDDTPLDDIIGGIIGDGLTPVGILAKAKELLAKFIIDPSEYNFGRLIFHLDEFEAESKEGHLFKAVATLLNVYNDGRLDFITDEENGLGLDLDTNFDLLNPEDLRAKLIELIDDPNADEIKDIFASLESTLSAVDSDLASAQGIESTSIELPGVGTVYLDDIDVTVLRAFAGALKAVCAYVQALDLDVDNWMVATAAGDMDVREFDEIPDGLEEVFLANNPDLFTYADTGKITAFKDAVIDVQDHLYDALGALDALDEAGIRARYNNAFNIDSEADFIKMMILVEGTLPGIIAAFDDPEQTIYGFHVETTDESVIDGGDGYAYWQETMDIILFSYEPSSDCPDDCYTLYSLINFEGEGLTEESPRSVFDAIYGLEEYTPYVETPPDEIWEDVIKIWYDEPIDTYTIPQAAISVDGNGSDWDGVATFKDFGDVQVKVARGTDDEVYLYIYKPAGFNSGNNNQLWLGSRHDDDGGFLGIYYQMSNMNEDDFILNSGLITSPSPVFDFEKALITSGETILGVEVEYDDMLSTITCEGCINSYIYGWSTFGELKFFPETPAP